MTIDATRNRKRYAGNGVTTAFGFPFPVFAPGDITVTLIDTVTGIVVAPAPVLNGSATYDYTFAGSQDTATGEYLAGGTLTFNTAPANNLTVVLVRAVAPTQDLALRDNSKFPAKSLEAALDRVTMLSQDIDSALNQVVSSPVSDAGMADLPVAGLRIMKPFHFGTDGNTPTMLNSTGPAIDAAVLAIQQGLSITTLDIRLITPQMFGAPNNGTDDDSAAIQAAIDWSYGNGFSSIFIPDTGIPYNIAAAGTPVMGEETVRGIIRLRPGVSVRSNGAHCILSGGRHNPPCMFFQDYVENLSIDDVKCEGLWIDGNMENQTWDPQEGPPPGDIGYQQSHGFQILRGERIEVFRCKFSSWRGDGCTFGDANVPPPNTRICTTVDVHHCEFTDIFREGIIFAGIEGAVVHHNYFHGDGYCVAGVDIERHSIYETVRNVEVHSNIFDFRDGEGPIERGAIAKYRRAVSIAFFYTGYPDGISDGLSCGHNIHHNTIYQGMMDCHMHPDVLFTDNVLLSVDEDLTGVVFITTDAIMVFNDSSQVGMTNVTIARNSIRSTMNGYGIHPYNYLGMKILDNTVINTGKNGIYVQFCGAMVAHNHVENVGTEGSPCSGVLIDGNQFGGGSLAAGNRAIDTREDPHRTVTYVVELAGSMDLAPTVYGNEAINLTEDEPVKLIDSQPNFALAYGNGTSNGPTWLLNVDMTVGSGVGARKIAINGDVNSDRTLQFETGGAPRVLIAIPGADGTDDVFAMVHLNNDGSFLRNILKATRSTKQVEIIGGKFVIDGTYDKPFIIGNGMRLWGDVANDLVYSSNVDPGSITAGFPLLQNGTDWGRWDKPLALANGSYLWVNPASTGSLWLKLGSAPTSVTDGVQIGP